MAGERCQQSISAEGCCRTAERTASRNFRGRMIEHSHALGATRQPGHFNAKLVIDDYHRRFGRVGGSAHGEEDNLRIGAWRGSDRPSAGCGTCRRHGSEGVPAPLGFCRGDAEEDTVPPRARDTTPSMPSNSGYCMSSAARRRARLAIGIRQRGNEGRVATPASAQRDLQGQPTGAAISPASDLRAVRRQASVIAGDDM